MFDNTPFEHHFFVKSLIYKNLYNRLREVFKKNLMGGLFIYGLNSTFESLKRT